MSHQTDLSPLGVTCQLFDVPGGLFRTLHLFCKLPDLACRKLFHVYIAVINCLGDKLFIFQEKPKDVPMMYLHCFWGYLAKATWVCTTLYHLSTDLFPCQKLVSKSNLALTSFNLGLQTLQTSPKWYQSLIHLWTSSKKHTGPCQNHHSKQSLSCIASFLVTWQAHTPECSHTSSTI